MMMAWRDEEKQDEGKGKLGLERQMKTDGY